MTATPAADRYARALLALAAARGVVAPLTAEVTALQAACPADAFKSAPLAKILVNALQQRGGLQPLLRDFLRVVARRRQTQQLPAMLQAFLAQAAAQRGEITAEVETAVALSAAQQTQLQDFVKAHTSAHTVVLKTQLNPALLAGFKVTWGSQQLDASATGALARLHQQLSTPA